MARRLLDRNRQREARRQVILLDRLTRQFRRVLEAELTSAMGEMLNVWEHTREVMMPRGFADRLEAIYLRMADAAIEAFSRRILQQGKHLGLELEQKEDFAQIMRRRALRYIQQEAIRKRIQGVAETTRKQIIRAVDDGYRAGATLPETASAIRSLIPALARFRADAIARTETHGAANYGSDQAARDTGLPLRREWLAAHDERTRETHAEADGQIVGADDPFHVGDSFLMYPGDPSAPPEETVNCFAPWSLIHVGGLKAAMFRDYCGDLIELSVGCPIDLAVTPNHPVLTARGWVAAAQIKEGDQLIKCSVSDDVGARVNPDECYGFAEAHQLYDLAQSLARSVRPHGVVVDLHGEMVAGENVDIVPLQGDLLAACNAPQLQFLHNFGLAESDISHGRFLAGRMVGLGATVPAHKADRRMGCGGSRGPLLGRQEAGRLGIPFTDGGERNPHVAEATVDGGAGNPDLSCDPVHGVSGLKKLLDARMVDGSGGKVAGAHVIRFESAIVTGIRRIHYSGPVFNFESLNGLLISDGIITHNCRCTLGYIVDDGI